MGTFTGTRLWTDSSGASTGPPGSGFTHTINVGDTLLVVSIGLRNSESVTAVPTWNTVPLTLILLSGIGTSNADEKIYSYALLNPIPAVDGLIDFTVNSTPSTFASVTNWSGTVVSSLAAAIRPVTEDINNDPTATSVLTGSELNTPTAGATMYAAGTFHGGDAAPVINDATYIFAQNTNTGGVDGTDHTLFSAYKEAVGAAPVTFTWQVSDENAAHLLEIIPAAASSAPLLTSPTDVATGSTTGQGQVTTDQGDGTLYGVVTQSAVAPSVAQIQTGQDDSGAPADWAGNQAVVATGVQTLNATGLATGTAYFFYFQQENVTNDDSLVAAADGFTTTSAPPVDPPYTENAVYDGTTIPEDSILHYLTGAHDGGDDAATFSDSALTMTVDLYIGLIVENRTDGSRGVIISNTATDIVATLAGGTDNNWDDLDEMHIVADIDNPDVMYSQSAVTVVAQIAPILWYIFDNSTGIYTELYTQTIEAAGSPDGEYSVSLDTQGVPTLTLINSGSKPTLSAPTGVGTGETTADGTVTTDHNSGTLFSLASVNAVEDSAAIKNGNTQVVSTTGVQNVNVGGLLAGTSYYYHYLHENAEGDSNIVVSSAFLTEFEVAVLSNPTQPVAPFTTLTASIDTDQLGGTLYYLVDENPTALAAAIKAGDSNPITGVTTQNITKVGLDTFTQYYVHYIQETSGDSNIVNSLPVTTGDVIPVPPTSNINDAILLVTGGPTINDGLAIWYNMQMSESLRDAEYRFLIENGATPRTINDMWFQLLTPTYGPGALNDMQLAYWLAGGVF